MPKIISQKLEYDDLLFDGDFNHITLTTEYDNGQVKVANLTYEEAQQWERDQALKQPS